MLILRRPIGSSITIQGDGPPVRVRFTRVDWSQPSVLALMIRGQTRVPQEYALGQLVAVDPEHLINIRLQKLHWAASSNGHPSTPVVEVGIDAPMGSAIYRSAERP